MPEEYQVIARRWRPKIFEDLVGQEPIVTTLENAIHLNKIAHAFLFIGPRGTGKTSMARLLAVALNAPGKPDIHADPNSEIARSIFEGHCIDVIEIDGASNNSVEQIRTLREECQYAPSTCRFKIYIIDEVHMLSQSAFNALLKTLEEPPSHVKFIFATTEAHKIPLTIASRCQRFEFHPISTEIIAKKLQKIADTEKISVETSAIKTIARIAKGGMRDAQSIFEQMVAFGNASIREVDIVQAYNLATQDEIELLANCILNSDYHQIADLSQKFYQKNLEQIVLDLELFFSQKLSASGDNNSASGILKIIDVLFHSHALLKDSFDPKIAFQVTLFRAIESQNLRKINDVIALLKKNSQEVVDPQPLPTIDTVSTQDLELETCCPIHPLKEATTNSSSKNVAAINNASKKDDLFKNLSTEAQSTLKNLFHIES